jgi:hypothetical protein
MATMGVPWLRLLLWFDDPSVECRPEYLVPKLKDAPLRRAATHKSSASRMVCKAANAIVKTEKMM